MPKLESSTPEKLRLFLFHGIDMSWDDRSATGTCPWCGREGKFSVALDTGLWTCRVCREGTEKGGGNEYTFLRKLWEMADKSTTDYISLATDRRLLPDTLVHWELVKSPLIGDWLVPGHDTKGNLCQLYKYVQGRDRSLLLPTPGMGHRLHGMPLFHPSSSMVYVCEGPWDAMALWEAMSQCKRSEDGLAMTASVDRSLLSDASVLAVPGCTTFSDAWLPLFEGKIVVLMFDNDHPRKNPKTGKAVAPAGWTGMERATSLLTGVAKEVMILRWGGNDADHDSSLPSGFDVRDALTLEGDGHSLQHRLEMLLAMVSPAPKEWTKATKHKQASHSSGEAMPCLPCKEYRALTTAWRKALRWTDGLDRALACMLASVASTQMVGDQLWLKVVGPAACLDGSTPIYDPTDNTNLSIADRCKSEKRFWVYTRKPGGVIGVSQALPPKRFSGEPMYRVSFRSGRQLCVTGGHQFWDGSSYVALHTIADALQQSSSYPLPTISGIDLSTLLPSVHHWTKTVEDSLVGCPSYSCSCGEPPHLAECNAQDVVPSQGGVLGCTQDILDGPVVLGCEYTLPPQLPCPPSNFRWQNPSLLLRRAAGCLSPIVLGVVEWFLYWWNTSLRIPRRIDHCCIKRLADHCRRLSNSTLSRYPLSVSKWKQWYWLSGTLLGNQQWSVLVDSSLKQIALANQSGVFSQISEAGHPVISMPVESVSGRYEGCVEFQPSYDCFDKARQLAEDDQTTLDAWYTSVGLDQNRVDLPILPETDAVVNIESLGCQDYYDFHVPETRNYWAEGFFHHNCGKSTLCEAVSVNHKYVLAKSTIRGFHSGFKEQGGDKEEDNSLLSMLPGKTLVTKDGDTLLQSPNLSQILSEGRDVYDGVSRTHYRNTMSKDYDGLRITWILCGTSSLRQIDSSELGERFLDCVIMENIDDDLEDEILERVVHRAARDVSVESNGEATGHYAPEMSMAMQLTGGYVGWLRENAAKRLSTVEYSPSVRRRITRLGKFVAHMRARPSLKQEEVAEREFATRLVSQLTRLAGCLSLVLNRSSVDDEVMRRVHQVAMDTSRGRTLSIALHLYETADGLESKTLAMLAGQTEEKTRALLRFLRAIQVAETHQTVNEKGVKGRVHWRLTQRMHRLCREVMGASDGREEKT